MKKIILCLTLFMILCLSCPVFAGWQQESNNTWKYKIDGQYTANAPTLVSAEGAIYAINKWWYIDGKYYAFDDQGILKVNTTVDGYQVNNDGQLLGTNGSVYTLTPNATNPKGFVYCTNACFAKMPNYYSQAAVNQTLSVEGKSLPLKRHDCSAFASVCVELYNVLNYNHSPNDAIIFASDSHSILASNHFNNVSSGYSIVNAKEGDIWIKPDASVDGGGHVMILTQIKQTSAGRTFVFKHLTGAGKRTSSVTSFSTGVDNVGNSGILVNNNDCGNKPYTVFYRPQ